MSDANYQARIEKFLANCGYWDWKDDVGQIVAKRFGKTDYDLGTIHFCELAKGIVKPPQRKPFRDLQVGDKFAVVNDGEILVKISELSYGNEVYNTICLKSAYHTLSPVTGKPLYEEGTAIVIFDCTKVFPL